MCRRKISPHFWNACFWHAESSWGCCGGSGGGFLVGTAGEGALPARGEGKQISTVQRAEDAGVRGARGAWRSSCGAKTLASNLQDAKLIPAHRNVAIDSDMWDYLHIY